MSGDGINVWTVLWTNGEPYVYCTRPEGKPAPDEIESRLYTPLDVILFERMVRRYWPNCRFRCLTNVGEIPGIECVPLTTDFVGWWPKMELFRPDLPGVTDGINVYFDLDTLIVRPPDRIARFEAAKLLGLDAVPTVCLAGLTEEQKRAFMLADNRLSEMSSWDDAMMGAELADLSGFDMSRFGFGEFAELGTASPASEGGDPAPGRRGLGSLAEQFGVPPFTVLSAREGWWQDRKRAWIALGIQSELGRGENLIGRSPQEVFCHATGMQYDKARKIVKEAMERLGDAFDLPALIAEHGGKMPAKNFSRSGAVMPVGGDVKGDLLKARGYE